MIRYAIILGMLTPVMGLGIMFPAFAEYVSPMAQYNAEVPIQEIQCRDSKILMETTRGTPACVNGDSVQNVQQRGWVVVQLSQQDDADILNIPTKLSTKRITTGNIDKTFDKMGELGPYADFWPQYSLTFPEQVRVGEQFEVVLDYTFIIPSINDDDDGVEFLDYEEPEMVCNEECLESIKYLDLEFHISRNAYVDLLNNTDYVLYAIGNDTRHLPIRAFEHGSVWPILNNTHPQQKTFTFVINEPDTEYPLGQIRIDFEGDGEGWIHFYVEPGNTVRLSDEPITIVGEGVPQLVMNLPNSTAKTLPQDPLSGVDDPEKLMHELAAFFEEYYSEGDVEAELRLSNFTDAFIDRFFTLYPDLRTQSFAPSLQFILPSAYAQSPSTSFVYGKAYYYDLDSSKTLLKNTEICAYTKTYQTYNPVMNGQTHVCDKTDTSGSFSLVSVPRSINLHLAAHAEGDDIKVVKNNNLNLHIHYDPIHISVNSGTINAGNFTLPSSGTQSLAFKLLGELEEIDQWYQDNFNDDPPYVTAVWDPEQCRSVGASGTSITFSHTKYTPINSEIICDKHKVSPITNPDTMAHEFAHVVFYDHYDSQDSDYPLYQINNPTNWHSPIHSGNTAGLAWVEGWAFFMANAYSGTPTYQPSYMTGQWNFETRIHNEVSDPRFSGKSFVTGITGEGNVAAALYDAFDTTDETGDDQRNQLTNIWNTMTDSLELLNESIIAADFFEFKNDWDDSSRPSLDSIFTLNTITSSTTTTNPSVILSETFDNLDAWTEQGETDWRTGAPDEGGHPTDNHPATNTVAEADNCDSECRLVLTDGLDLTGYSSASLSLYRYVDNSLDSGEYLKIDASSNGGTTWSNIFTWNEEGTDDDTWHSESYDLASYLTSADFKVRAVAKMSSSSEEVMIDDLTITGTPRSTGGGDGNSSVSVLHSDGFGENLNAYTLSGDDDWEVDDPHVDIPGSDPANEVLTSSNCDDECIITIDASLDTTSLLTIAFDRFVDTSIDAQEGLFVEYSVNGGTTWVVLDSFGQDNNKDSNVWESEMLTLDVVESSAKMRFVAKSSSSSEYIEIDNLTISQRNAASVSSFSDDFQGDLSSWNLSGDSDWEIGEPDEDIAGTANSNKVLTSSNCDDECIITLNSKLDTSSGPLVIEFKRFVDRRVDSNEGLYVQYSTTTNGTTTTWTNLATYTDTNNQDTDVWTNTSLTLDNIAESTAGFRFLADSSSSNEKVEIDDLSISPRPDTAPVISAISNQSLQDTQTRTVNVIATDADGDEITLTLVSPPDFVTISGSTITIDPARSDVGVHTITVKATANGASDTESFTVAVTNGGGGDGGNPLPDTIPPVVTAPADVTFEATGTSTTITAAQLGTATATDNLDPNPTITNNATATFPLGTTIVVWTATDSSGNSANAAQTVTIQDTTPPEYVHPIANYTLPAQQQLVFPIPVTLPQAADNLDDGDNSNVEVFCNPSHLNKVGNTQVWCHASDGAGNTKTVSFTVTVPLESMFVLEPITAETCQVRVQLGEVKEFKLDECDSEYAGVPYSFIPRSPYFGDVEISEDGTTLVITAPPPDLTAIANNNNTNNNPSQQQQLVDEFGVTIDDVAHNRPRVDVRVIYYE